MKRLYLNPFLAFFYLLVMLLHTPKAEAQEQEQEQEQGPTPEEQVKRFSIVPLPFVAANPTAGFLFGLTPAINFYTADPATTSMSTAIVVALISTRHQYFSSIRSNAFLKEDRWSLFLDTRYNINNLPIYTLGTKMENTQNERLFFDMFRFYGTALRRHQDSRFFYGLGYLFDRMFNIAEGYPPQTVLPSAHELYQSRNGMSEGSYMQSGVSFNSMWDSRDNVANTYTGSFTLLSWRAFPQFLGSSTNSSQFWLEHRNYFGLNPNRPRHLLALWTYAWLTTGDVPYLFLPGVGLDMFNRSGRPYTFGRFRGEQLVYGELEWRFPLLRRKDWLGGVVFVNSTSASNLHEGTSLLEHLQFAYGTGLRIAIIPKKRVNLGIDYGWGAGGARGYFINLNEVF